MRKSLIFTILLVSIYNCKAQTVIYNIDSQPEDRTVEDNYYYKDIDNYYSSVLGIWKWEENNSSFEITLSKFEMYSYPNNSVQFWDAIFGKYKYVENGNVISQVTQINTFPNSKLSFFFVNPTKYNVVITDVVSNKHKVGEFIIISPNTATLELWDSGGVRIGGNVSLLPFSLPTSIVLTKQ